MKGIDPMPQLDAVRILLIAAVAFNGILTGASLDQLIKQLPARRRMGVIAFSAYSRAADLGNGIVWYAIIGVGAALLTIAASVGAYLQAATGSVAIPLYLAALLSLLHSFTTTQAAPTLFRVRQVKDDAAQLTVIFDRFERWQALRAALQVVAFGLTLWALAAS
jgi:hypothetical protein